MQRGVYDVSFTCRWHPFALRPEACKLQSKQRGGEDGVPALSSAKRAPTRSECFKNLSAQCDRHCSYSGDELHFQPYDNGVASYFFCRQGFASEVVTTRSKAPLDQIRVHLQEVLHLCSSVSKHAGDGVRLQQVRTCFFSKIFDI